MTSGCKFGVCRGGRKGVFTKWNWEKVVPFGKRSNFTPTTCHKKKNAIISIINKIIIWNKILKCKKKNIKVLEENIGAHLRSYTLIYKNQKRRKVNFTISKVRNFVHPKHLKEKGGEMGKSIMKEKTFALLQ